MQRSEVQATLSVAGIRQEPNSAGTSSSCTASGAKLASTSTSSKRARHPHHLQKGGTNAKCAD